MPRPYRPMAIANHLIRRFGYEDGITHMKLQKLVYYAHGWWLAYRAPDQLLNERPQVWRHGPVFRTMYQALKGFGNSPIKLPQREFPLRPPFDIDEDDEDSANLVEWVWLRYGNYSAIQLSNMTHEPGTPWRQLAEEHHFRVPQYLEISDALMRDYFINVEAPKQGIRIEN